MNREQRKQQIFDALTPAMYQLKMVDTQESIDAMNAFIEVSLVDEFEKGIRWDNPCDKCECSTCSFEKENFCAECDGCKKGREHKNPNCTGIRK